MDPGAALSRFRLDVFTKTIDSARFINHTAHNISLSLFVMFTDLDAKYLDSSVHWELQFEDTLITALIIS